MADPIAPDVLALDPRFGPLAEATQRIERLPLGGLLTYLVAAVPSGYLPELVRQFHIAGIEGGRFAATDDERRRLIRESIALHRKKGTPWAIRRALAQIGVEAELIEPRDVRRAYAALNPLRLDGAWRLDGAGHVLKAVEIASGLPYIEHWATFLVRINLDLARGYDMAAVREAIREWAPAARHPVLFYWLAQDYRQPLAADQHLLLDKRICQPYRWPGAALHGCPGMAWRIGRAPALDGRAFGFRLGASATPTQRLRARRCGSDARVVKSASARVWPAARLPAVRARRLDGRWRIGAECHIGRFTLDGRPLAHARFAAPSNGLTVSGRWRIGGPMQPDFEMRSIHV
ncbi:phage tail protein [Thiobacter aerophilum]|uniref:Phage tail protein n=1 Tax=Thiobacter aerophilum TaxID=3121275 RepID=A0ABV0EDQ7_9BURK